MLFDLAILGFGCPETFEAKIADSDVNLCALEVYREEERVIHGFFAISGWHR
jgi:hypothetical protein